MKYTEKLGLKKPESTDYVNIEDINENMDILDEQVGELKEGSTVIEDLQTENKTLSGAINELSNKKVDKVTGKGLSTNDYTDEEKQKNQDNADNISDLQQELETHKAEKATQDGYGHIRLQDIPSPKIATQAEAEAGTNNTKMMTPLRVVQAMKDTKGTVSSDTITTGIVTNQNRVQVNVSNESEARVYRSQVNASSYSKASAYNTQINASTNSESIGQLSQINASKYCYTNNENYPSVGGSVIIASSSVRNEETGVVVGGSGQGDASTQNRKWELSGRNGTIKASGAITGNSSFADFAEYFESENGKLIPLGTIVSLAEGGKIKVAQEGEYMIGIISQTAGIILNAQGFEWKNRYLYDRYGQPILVDKEVEKEVGYDDEGNPITEIEIIKAPMLNPNWDETQEYIPREEREEWNVVGLTGQIYTNVDDTVKEGDFIKVGQNGIATKGRNEYGQNWQVMKITTPYEEDLEFGIAVVFVR